MRFSQKIGKTSIRSIFQVDDMDDDLRNGLWNIILDDFINTIRYGYYIGDLRIESVFEYLWIKFFKNPIDAIPHYANSSGERTIYNDDVLKIIRKWYFETQWHQVYDFIECLAKIDNSFGNRLDFENKCNVVLKNELSGFRVVKGYIVQITSEEEIRAIEEAVANTTQWESVNKHLNASLGILSDRKNPVYRNSIKESISAVEALCVIITNDKKATLGKALGIIEKTYPLHRALKESFSSLYGYTSDSSGIRHSLLENDAVVDIDEAKFMLVSCSAFINFLKSKFNTA
jgi:hypothetical protein